MKPLYNAKAVRDQMRALAHGLCRESSMPVVLLGLREVGGELAPVLLTPVPMDMGIVAKLLREAAEQIENGCKHLEPAAEGPKLQVLGSDRN